MKKLFSICMDKFSDETIPEEDFLVKNYDDDILFEELENITKAHVDKVTKSRFKAVANYLALSLISVALTLLSTLMINSYARSAAKRKYALTSPLKYIIHTTEMPLFTK